MRLKTLLFGCASILASAVLVVPAAQAFTGGWEYDDNPGGFEILYLGDNSDDTYRRLSGTKMYCGSPGVPYARIRNVIDRNYPHQINWWVSNECDGGYIRVCVENRLGESACSTYVDGGWN